MVRASLAGSFGIGRQRLAVADVAEGAAAGADVAEDHEGGRALAEAFADVRAGGFLADGVQLLLAQDLLDLAEARRAVAGLDADPRRLLQQRSSAGTILIGMRAVLASPFCLTSFAGFARFQLLRVRELLAPVARCLALSQLPAASARRERARLVTAMPA
jgi:hypothetical protein